MVIENKIHIESPLEVVWSVTENIENWPKWTPTVESIKRNEQGQLGVGSTALLKQPGLPATIWTVTDYVRGELFSWESRSRGITTKASHKLTTSDSGTQNVLSVEISGLILLFLWPLIRFKVRRLLEQENAGLKKHCETMNSQ